MDIAFIDESGSPSPADGAPWFVVAALIVSSAREIELHIRRARRSLKRRLPKSELKASNSDPRTIRRVLEAIAEAKCEIYAVAVEKCEVPTVEAEATYQTAVAQVASLVIQSHPRLHICLDRRYTKPIHSLALEQRIREAIAHIPEQMIIITQEDSIAQPGLQAADFVAWAIRRLYEGDEDWAKLIEGCIVQVEVVRTNKTAALPGSR